MVICHRNLSNVEIVADTVEEILKKQHLESYSKIEVSKYVHSPSYWLFKALDKDPYRFDIFLLDAYDPAFVELADKVRSCNARASIIFMTDHIDDERMNRDMFRFRPTALVVDINRPGHLAEALHFCCEEQRLANPFITLKVNRQDRNILLHDILYIRNDAHSSTIATVTEDLRVNRPLSQIIRELPDKMFLRCHVSYCVNMSRVKAYRAELNSFVVDVRLSSIPISRQYSRAVLDRYRDYRKSVGLG